MRWQMRIERIFRFRDSRVVLVGPIQGCDARIPPGECDLLIGENPHSKLRIEGEMIPARSGRPDFRAVSTKEFVHVDDEVVGQGLCRLVGHSP